MRTIIVRPHGGLCNRLRALFSAGSYAEATGRAMFFAWLTDDSFGAEFDDLWARRAYRRLPSGMVSAITHIVGGCTAVDDVAFEDPRRVLVLHSNAAILRGDARLRPWVEIMKQLPLERRLARRIAETWEEGHRGRPTVGLMIRSHPDAHSTTRNASPPDWFFARMKELRERRPDVEFFLSTDNPDVSEAVHTRFDRVHELGNKSAHNSRGGVRDALCDLYLLASTHYILGSHWSSFSETAAMLAGTGAYETSQQEPTHAFDEAIARSAPPPALQLCEGTPEP